MKVFVGILIVAIIAISAVVLTRRIDNEPQDPIFMYYPRANVYYNITSKSYYRFDSLENSWKKSKELTAQQKSRLGKNVVINIVDDPIWKNNDKHRLIYGTSLYTSGDEVRKKFIEDSIRSLPPKKPVVVKKPETPATTEEKKVSGFRRFMDRIFKKKNKKE